MAIAKPAYMDGDYFAGRVATIVDWFASLNPYAFGGSILKVEDENVSLETGEPEPLYCLAISSKRYALFNLAPDGSPIMRKVSAHGLGHLRSPYSADDAPAHLPTPHATVLRQGVERWHCDLWHHIVVAAQGENPNRVPLDYSPALTAPAISRYTASSADLLRWFKTYNADRTYREQVKPFGFLIAMSAAFGFDTERIAAAPTRGRRKKVAKVKPVAPYTTDPETAAASAFDRDSGAAVIRPAIKSYAEALAQYHLSPESKFLNADYSDRGTTIRRHVRMTSALHIGKESYDWERQAMLGLSLDSEIAYGVAPDDLPERLRPFAAEHGEQKAAKALGVSAKRLATLIAGTHFPGDDRLQRKIAALLPAAIELCAKLSFDKQAKLHRLREDVERDGLRQTARRLEVDASNLRRRLKG